MKVEYNISDILCLYCEMVKIRNKFLYQNIWFSKTFGDEVNLTYF